MKKSPKDLLKSLLKNQELIMKHLKIEIPVEEKKQKTSKDVNAKEKSKEKITEKKK